ncbi:hypothetical protein ACHWQZ_G010216 [Mnemiopsis leidyi]
MWDACGGYLSNTCSVAFFARSHVNVSDFYTSSFRYTSVINTNYNYKSTIMAYRLIDPQVLLNKLLKTRTSHSAVEVINNNLSDRRLGEKTPEATRRTPLLNEGYGLLLNNSNSPFTPLGFESVAPVNSPDINFEPPPVLKGAFTETVQTRPKIMSTFRPLPKQANLPPRPKAADPRGRRRPEMLIEKTNSQESLELEEECLKIARVPTVKITPDLPKMKMTKSSQLRKLVSDFRMRPSTAHHSRRRAAHLEDITKTQEKSSNKGGRPKGAHHRIHPMFIPGMLDETTDDDLDDLLTPSSPIELPVLRIPIVSPEVPESPRYEPKLTFVPGPPPDSPELDLTLSIRGTGVNQAELVDQLRKRQEPNSYYKPFCKPSTTLAPPTKPPVRASTQESEEERAAITEIEAILNLQPESRSSNYSGIETQPSAERPLNRPRQILLPGAVISDSDEELPCPPPKREIKIELQTFASVALGNSPAIHFEPPPVLKGALSKTAQPRPKMSSTIPLLPTLANLPPQLLKTMTSNTAVEVLNNNISEIRRLGEKTPEARQTLLLNEGYGLLLNNSNSPFTPRGFESVAPVNSPDINFEPPPVLKGAFTENVQTRPKIMSTIPPLPKLANLPPRPKAANPRGRRRPDIAIEETISKESLELEEEC